MRTGAFCYCYEKKKSLISDFHKNRLNSFGSLFLFNRVLDLQNGTIQF